MKRCTVEQLTFHKVVRQQNSGEVEDFILPYSAVYLRIQTWKNYWNRSTFAKVIVKIKVARFLWPTVYITTFDYRLQFTHTHFSSPKTRQTGEI